MQDGDIWLIDADPTAADRHLTQLTDGDGLAFAPRGRPWAVDRVRGRLAGSAERVDPVRGRHG